MAWKGEVIADNSGTWCGNGLTFATQAECDAYLHDLMMRWLAVREVRSVEVEGPATHSWTDDGLRNLDRPEETRRIPARRVQL